MPTRDVEIIDLRSLQPAKPGPDAAKRYRIGAGGKVLERQPEAVLGVGLHQTSCIFGVSSVAIKAAGGSAERAKDLRALKVAAHVVVWSAPPGPPRIVLANPLRWHVNHGNALNPFSVGIEFEADLPGRVRQGPFSLTEEQVRAGQQALATVVELGRKEGCPMTHLWAHRQSNGKKPGDPGEELWQRLVLEFAVPKLGLVLERDRFWKGSTAVTPTGRAIPKEWDPDAKASYQ